MRDVALAATQAIPFSIGGVLAGRYELKALLGEGGMGAVFRAHDRELDEDVALKVLHADASTDAAALTRFRREVKLARRVTHRNVARTFDLGMHEGARFLTMELIVGESLGARRARAPLHLPEALRVAAEIARGLAAAHVVGVVHRDLKPDNVMLAEDERVVLTDFGIARVVEAGAADAMRTGMIVGTPAYMAPEQLENLAIDGRTDVYALGTMIFELASGKLPFAGESPLSIAAQRITNDAPDLRGVAPLVPEALAVLVKETLARRREDRPDAQSVLDRLEALRGNATRGAHVAVRLPSLTQDTFASLGQPRTVAVQPLTGHVELGAILTEAIAAAIAETRVASFVQGSEADLVVTGTLHASGDRVRVRLRVSGRKGATLWASHVDGALSSTLDLEDAVVAAVIDALRARTAHDPGPSDASLREGYEKARDLYQAFALPHVQRAIGILEEIEAKKPGDPHVRALLARCVMGVWGQTGARDRAMFARAEELALRALDGDPTIGGAHYVISQVRLADGELVAALRAAEECLRHDPRLGDGHCIIGGLLCEALFVNEGRRRIDLAARLDPKSTTVAYRRIQTLALIGERDKAKAIVDGLVAQAGPLSAVVITTRLAAWWNDKDIALAAAAAIEEAKAGAAWDPAAMLMRSLVSGQFEPRAPELLGRITDASVAPRQRAMMNQIAAEYYGAMNRAEETLKHVAEVARLPSTDLLWLDACPPLAFVRGDPRFSEARATVAARCADLWGAIGTWPA